MKLMKYISKLMSILVCLHLWSCDVHEFPHPIPEDENISFILHLDYDTTLPYYRTIEYSEDARSIDSQQYDARYIVKVYPAVSESGTKELYSFVFTKADVNELDHSVTLDLKKGNYKFIVWTDYVIEGTKTDYLYDTSTFDKISLKGNKYQGNTDLKDAFKGTITTEVSANLTEALVLMERPVAKFRFISTDFDRFMSQVIESQAVETASKTVSLEDFKIVFRYQGYLPNAYNLNSDQSSGSLTEKEFESVVYKISDSEVEMGFDYVFAQSAETSVYITVEISDTEGNVLSSFTTIEIPLLRGKLTTVNAKFLPSQSDGGAGIDPDYNGDINIEIK